MRDLGAAAHVGGQELAGLLGQVQEDGTGLEQGDGRAAVGGLCVDDGGDAVVGRDGQKFGFELIAAADVHRMDLVGQAGFFKEQRDLVAVGGGPVVEIDHGVRPGNQGAAGRAGGWKAMIAAGPGHGPE
ncbi:hypothetical protein D3C73_1404910 [compost metagenome]